MISNLLWQNEIKDNNNHPICIYELAFSPDGNTLLVAADNKVYVFEPKNGSLIQTLKGHKDSILSLSFSRDGKRFATGSIDKQVIIWTSKWEAILKYTHNESIRCLQYNPTSYQLLSCTNSDFGLWSPEQKNVSKVKVTSQINCCCWNDDGVVFALGFNCGTVSIRFKHGDEQMKIERKGAIWGLLFYKSVDAKNEDRLAVVDWAKTISTYDLKGNQSTQERNLNYDPLFITSFMNNEFLLIGGTNKQATLYTIEGIQLETVSSKESWIWCCKPNNSNRLAIGCQNGSLCLYEISLMAVDCLYKDLYAYRHSMTNVIIQHLNTKEKARIKCRDLVKKIAIYKTLLAIQLQKRIILYESNDDLSYRVKEKINLEIDCSLLMLGASNLIICHQQRLQSFDFHGQLQREWMLKNTVMHLKTVGGQAKQESLLVGLNDGQILMVFLSNIFPVELVKLSSPIRFIDISMKRQKIAVLDDQNNCSVYDIHTKQLLFEETNVTSFAWNSQFEDLLCLAGPNFMAIKMHDVPTQTIQFCDQSIDVVGYSGNKIFALTKNRTIITEEISYSKLMLHFIQQNKLHEAYQIACLNVTLEDWQMLTSATLAKCELALGFKCISRVGDWSYQELIYSHFQLSNPLSETNKQLFLAKYYAYQGLFAESAKLFKKINQPHLALEMFTDLQMYEQAKEYQHLTAANSNQHPQNDSVTSATVRNQAMNTATAAVDFNDLKALSKMYIAKGDHKKASEMIEKSDVNSIMAMVNQIDKGEIKLLNLIAESFIKSGDYGNAIQIYRKIGDFKRLALIYIENNQWEQALKIANEIPHTKKDIYFPYAMWLAENERFAEAQQAFYESGQFGKSRQVLNRLLENSINECRFNDASYYSWLLANHFKQMTYGSQFEDNDNDNLSSRSPVDHRTNLETSDKLHQEAELYYAYQYIYKYIEEPFTSVYAEILFNSALFLFQYIDGTLPTGVSKVYILFALAKLGKTLGHFKLVRIAYKKLKNLRLPDKLAESIHIGSIEIRTKPFVDAEELSQFCYRCSSTGSLFNSKMNQCINCNQKFVHSFYSFDILPLVEFEIKENITHEQFERILIKNRDERAKSSQRRGSITLMSNVNGQQSEVFMNDFMVNNGEIGQSDQDQVINLNGGEVNEITNLVVLNDKHLSKLNQSNVIIVKQVEQGGPGQQQNWQKHRYYLNMMPEIGIVACPHCSKVSQPVCSYQHFNENPFSSSIVTNMNFKY